MERGQSDRNIALRPLIVEKSDYEQRNDQCANDERGDGVHLTSISMTGSLLRWTGSLLRRRAHRSQRLRELSIRR
jgi:hypothetical protein